MVFNILTSETPNNLNGAHTQKPFPPIKKSQKFPLSTLNEHPLGESSDNSHDPTHSSALPSGTM